MRKNVWLLAALLSALPLAVPLGAAPRRKSRKTSVAPTEKAPAKTPVRVAPMRLPRVPSAPDLERPITGAAYSLPQTVIEATRWRNRAAFRLTDGRSEAVVVPSLGRVMSYKLLGGDNWLWNAPAKVGDMAGWKNWGGDKTWPSPQTQWHRLGSKTNWPPPPAWDGAPHRAQIVNDANKGAMLRTTSALAPGSNARIIREYRFENGDFVITQIVEKTTGAPTTFGIWSIAQVNFPDAVYLPLREGSIYKNNWLWQSAPFPEAPIRNISDSLLEIRPAIPRPGKGIKVGADAEVAALVAVKNGIAFRARASRPPGEYPDGAPGHGTPVEVFVNGDLKAPYIEMELLSPLLKFNAGSRFRHTVRWSLHELAHKNIDDEELPNEVEALLRAQ